MSKFRYNRVDLAEKAHAIANQAVVTVGSYSSRP